MIYEGNVVNKETVDLIEEYMQREESILNPMPYDGFERLQLEPSDFSFLVAPTRKQLKLMKKLQIKYHADLGEARQVILNGFKPTFGSYQGDRDTEGMPHGFGKMIYEDGSVYEG